MPKLLKIVAAIAVLAALWAALVVVGGTFLFWLITALTPVKFAGYVAAFISGYAVGKLFCHWVMKP